MRTNEDRRDQYAENRAAGLCSCGNERRPEGKTCQRCYDAGVAARARIKQYAAQHGVTYKKARAAVVTRHWYVHRPPPRCDTCGRTNCKHQGGRVCQLHAKIAQLERRVQVLTKKLRRKRP